VRVAGEDGKDTTGTTEVGGGYAEAALWFGNSDDDNVR